MNTMRAAIFDASTKQLTIENVPIPEPGPGEVPLSPTLLG